MQRVLGGALRRREDPAWVTAAHQPLSDAEWTGCSISLLNHGGESIVFRIVCAEQSLDVVAKCFFRQQSRANEVKFARLLSKPSSAAAACTRQLSPHQLPKQLLSELRGAFCKEVLALAPHKRPRFTTPAACRIPASSLFVSRLQHKLGRMVTSDHPPLLFRYYDGCLADAIGSSSRSGACRAQLLGEPFSLQRACGVVLQCLRALEAHHRVGVLHGDLKPSNILFCSEGASQGRAGVQIVLADYGQSLLACDYSPNRSFRRGTPTWRAPEVFRPPVRLYQAAADVYAMGSALLDLLAGRSPSRDKLGPERSLSHERRATALLKPAFVSATALCNALLPMIHDDAAQRPALQVTLNAVAGLATRVDNTLI